MTLLLPAFVGAPAVNRVYQVDAMTLLRAIPDNSVDCCVTSPPYFGLRDYGVAGQIGLEATPAEYVQTLVTLFREVRRVLKDSGSFWLNLGDSYTGSGKGPSTHLQTSNPASQIERLTSVDGLASKNLLLMPHRVAIALQDDGWICRQDNVWAKPNPMPESVTDRTTRAHEYVFQFAKSGKYYYDAEAIREVGAGRLDLGKMNSPARLNEGGLWAHDFKEADGRNKRSVWTIPPAQFREAHFATFPLKIPEICIKAGCPPGGLVLDPFMGSGTTADVARRLGRDYIGSELSFEYMQIINKRLAVPYTPLMPMFLEPAGELEASLS